MPAYGDVGNKVSGYLRTRADAIMGAVNDVSNRAKTEGIIGTAVKVVSSGFGLLPINDYGVARQQAREAARHQIAPKL